MEGIQYIVDEHGERKAVVIDLDTLGDLWEDIHDALVVQSRKDEPRAKWEQVKKRLTASD